MCPQCNAGYPLLKQNERDWRYGMSGIRFFMKSELELQCIRCGVVTVSDKLVTWTPAEGFTAAQMAAAGSRVRRVSRKNRDR